MWNIIFTRFTRHGNHSKSWPIDSKECQLITFRRKCLKSDFCIIFNWNIPMKWENFCIWPGGIKFSCEKKDPRIFTRNSTGFRFQFIENLPPRQWRTWDDKFLPVNFKLGYFSWGNLLISLSLKAFKSRIIDDSLNWMAPSHKIEWTLEIRLFTWIDCACFVWPKLLQMHYHANLNDDPRFNSNRSSGIGSW